MAKSLHAPRYRDVPAFLRELRKQAGLTQSELAARLKVMQSTIHKSEIGERRVDVTEFIDWSIACGHTPYATFRMLMNFRQERGIAKPKWGRR